MPETIISIGNLQFSANNTDAVVSIHAVPIRSRRPIRSVRGNAVLIGKTTRSGTPSSSSNPTVRFDCIATHGRRETRIARIRGRGVAQSTTWGDDRLAAEVPMEVLTKYTRDAVERDRIGARVQEAN